MAGADTKKLWSIIYEIIDRKQCKHKLPNKFNINGEEIRNKKNIATAFNQYFASIGTEMADSLPNEPGYEEYLPTPRTTFEFRHVKDEDIEKIMKSQQPKLSCGVDTINNKICLLYTSPSPRD